MNTPHTSLGRRLASLVIGCLMAVALYAQSDDINHSRDSLLQVISQTDGQERLDAYDDLALLFFFQNDADTAIYYLSLFEQEATRQQKMRKASAIRANITTLLLNKARYTEVQERAEDDLAFIAKAEAWEAYFCVYENFISSYFYLSQYEEALAIASRCYEESKQIDAPEARAWPLLLLGNAYRFSGRNNDAIGYYIQCIDASGTQDACLVVKTNAYTNLARMYYIQEEYDKLGFLLPDWEAELKECDRLNKMVTTGSWSNFYSSSLYYHLACKNYERATYDCERLEAYNNSVTQQTAYYGRMKLAMAHKQYDEALKYATLRHEHWLATSQNSLALSGSFRAVGFALAGLGRIDECIEAIERSFALNDSIATLDVQKQLDELRTVYEVDKLTAEKERNRNYFLFALSGCCLLALALGIWIYLNRQITRKNRALARQIREQIEQQEARERELLARVSFLSFNNGDNANNGDFDDEFDCPEARKDRLCIAIRDLMLREKVYRDKHVSRDQVVERLGTNKMLFTDAFQYCFNMSFSEYINSLRLKEAIQLLEDPTILIDTISERTGFGTVRSFQRQFRAQYNMSPKEYRNMIQKEVKA